MITEDVPKAVAADKAFQNAKLNSDEQNARLAHDRALGRVLVALIKDDTELYKHYSDNEWFKKWLADTNFEVTHRSS